MSKAEQAAFNELALAVKKAYEVMNGAVNKVPSCQSAEFLFVQVNTASAALYLAIQECEEVERLEFAVKTESWLTGVIRRGMEGNNQ